MSRFSIAAAACVFSASALVAGAQQQQQQQQQQKQEQEQTPVAKEITVRGCLSPSVDQQGGYILKSAQGEKGVTGTGLRFVIVPDNDGIQLKQHMNTLVQITGPWDGRAQPRPGITAPENTWPVLRVRTISMVSNECI